MANTELQDELRRARENAHRRQLEAADRLRERQPAEDPMTGFIEATMLQIDVRSSRAVVAVLDDLLDEDDGRPGRESGRESG